MLTAAPRLPRRVDLGELSPMEVAARLRHLPGLVFFDSATETGRLSIVAARPAEIRKGTLERDWGHFAEALRARSVPEGVDDGLPHGLAAGYAGYDGSFVFGFYEEALFFEHATGSWRELGTLSAELREPAVEKKGVPPEFRPRLSCAEFCGMVERAQEYIAAGDIYQVNLAHRFTAEWTGDPFALYRALRECSPAPQSAFLELEDGRCSRLRRNFFCSSPAARSARGRSRGHARGGAMPMRMRNPRTI